MSSKWWVLAAVACGTFMATLDSSIVNIALPTMTHDLGQPLAQIKWIIILYLLVITWLLLPFGKLSDLHGRKHVFQWGYLIFTLGSAACGFAPGLGWLLAARALQGVGAAMLMANGPALITAAFPLHERGKALGTMSMVVSAGLVSGPSIGGMLISGLHWRSIFLVNVPIGVLGFFLVHRYVKSDREVQDKRAFDWVGSILQMILLTLFMLFVDPPRTHFLLERLPLGIALAMVIFLFAFQERRSKNALFDFDLLCIRTFWTSCLASFLTFVSFSSVSVLMPFFLETTMNFGPHETGLFMTAIPITVFIVAPIAGRLSDIFGSKVFSFLGALVGALGFFLMSGVFGLGVHARMSSAAIVLALSSIGLATGLFQSPNNAAIMSSVPGKKLGVASALIATVRNLGLVTGTGLATTLFSWQLKESGQLVTAIHAAFLASGILAIGATIAALGKKEEFSS